MNQSLSSLRFGCGIVVNDFCDFGEGDFDDFTVGAFHLDAGFGESLRHLHAADDAAHMIAALRDDFDVAFAVKRLERCEGFCDFQCVLPRFLCDEQL
jgi:hypothetical protein